MSQSDELRQEAKDILQEAFKEILGISSDKDIRLPKIDRAVDCIVGSALLLVAELNKEA